MKGLKNNNTSKDGFPMENDENNTINVQQKNSN